jgi:pyridoxal biosynthesis lyase PdxS
MDMTVKNMNGSRHQLNQKARSAPSASADRDTSHQRRMNSLSERTLIRTLHLVLSIPIIGFIYGPVATIPPAASFTRFVAVPVVVISGIWLWQKPRLLRWLRARR